MGIRIKILFTSLLLGSGGLVTAGSSLNEREAEAYEIIDVDPERGNALYKELLKEAVAVQDYALATKCNLLMGWSQEVHFDNLGRAVIYYLESVRFAENGRYDIASSDLIKGLQLTGSIFQRFNDFENALDYYERAMEIALEHDLLKEYCQLLVSSAQLQSDAGNYRKALELLNSCFDYFQILGEKTIATIYNERGLIYTELGELDKSLESFRLLQEYVKNHESLKLEYTALSLHNIGDAYKEQGRFVEGAESYKAALTYKKNHESTSNSTFLTLTDLGECLIESGYLDEASQYLAEAEDLMDESVEKSRVFRLYKLISRIHLIEGEMEAYATYQELYGTTIQNYLQEKQQIEATDKKYNLELITKRYFEMIEIQERNQEIRRYAQISVVSLLLAILTILGYVRYSRYRLRRDLEESLRPYAETAYVE
ncbi:MAG: tetratricopeptide repeat protein [Bacteroidota bacterium]